MKTPSMLQSQAHVTWLTLTHLHTKTQVHHIEKSAEKQYMDPQILQTWADFLHAEFSFLDCSSFMLRWESVGQGIPEFLTTKILSFHNSIGHKCHILELKSFLFSKYSQFFFQLAGHQTQKSENWKLELSSLGYIFKFKILMVHQWLWGWQFSSADCWKNIWIIGTCFHCQFRSLHHWVRRRLGPMFCERTLWQSLI